MGDSKPPQATSTTLAIVEEKLEETIRQKEDGEVSTLRRWFSKLGGDSKTTPQKKALIMAKADSLMYKRWGSPGSPTYELVMKYWLSTRMQKHWLFLHGQHPRQFRRNLERGYMEPIPVSWIQSRHLARPLPESSPYETEAQKRLYYLLNNSTLPDGSRHPTLLPLHSTRNRITIINRGNERIASQVPIDPHKLASYKSPRDVFHSDPQIKSHAYSPQVPTSVSAARTQALQELADGIRAGTDRLETMLLLDVSDSMTQNPHAGIRGPDGVTRFHDQPSHIVLVKNLVHRCLHHMVPCAQKQTPSQTSIETLALNSTATLIFPLSPTTFAHDWPAKVLPDGGTQTQLIPSFHTLKTTFHSQHRNTTTLIPPFGPQPTPSTPKLSLLIFLAGEAADMDEFELELLGEPWVYVTIVLVGMENCPFHHRRAGEWERVARFNPRVGVFEVSGRVCERWVVEEVIGSVFPVGAPGREEVLRGGFDLGGEEVGGDVRFE
ncbi:hypothetical protein MMC30_007079 [Trapelia coarctata]|nr:hypothetical protein [Trapelia coarctata]